MRRAHALAAAFAAAAALGCDLPTDAAAARDHLSRGVSKIVPFDVPFPALVVRAGEAFGDSLADIGTVVDTTDFTVRLEPETTSVAGRDVFRFDPVAIAGIRQSYDASVAPFDVTASVTAPPIPVSLTTRADSAPLVAAGPGSLTFSLDLSADFFTATFAAGSEMRLTLSTNGASSITGVTVALRDAGGTALASSATPVSVAPGGTATILIPLGGVTLPSAGSVVVGYTATTGNGALDALKVSLGFTSAAVTQATGVDAARISPVTVSRKVALASPSSNVADAVVKSGTVALKAFRFGDLAFTPAASFETSLAGKRVGSAQPDSVTVAGTVSAPAGATRLAVSTTGTVTVRLSDVAVDVVTLKSVDFTADRVVQLLDPSSPQYSGVSEVRVRKGSVDVDVTNRLPIAGQVFVTLIGATDASGQPYTRSLSIPAAGAAPATVRLTLPLDGAVVYPAILRARAVGVFRGTSVAVTTAAAADAFRADPSLSAIEAASVTIAGAPGLRFPFARGTEVSASSLGLSGAREALTGVSFAAGDILVRLENPSRIALAIDSLTVSLVDAVSGAAIADASGQPAKVVVANASGTVFAVRAAGTDSAAAPAAGLLNALVQSSLAGRRVSLRVAGRQGFGAGAGSVTDADTLMAVVRFRAPVDLTLPAAGVSLERVDRRRVSLGGGSSDLVADLATSLATASLVLVVRNATPVRVEADVALAPSPTTAAPWDPFTATPRFVVPRMTIPAATVDASGAVTSPRDTTITISLTTAELETFRHGDLGLALKVTMKPAAGGRARIRSSDYVSIAPVARLGISTTGK